jgi:hypothetical protein
MNGMFLIRDGANFVDGFDGTVEWTIDKRTAWHMSKVDAERRLQAWKEKGILPVTAEIVEGRR